MLEIYHAWREMTQEANKGLPKQSDNAICLTGVLFLVLILAIAFCIALYFVTIGGNVVLIAVFSVISAIPIIASVILGTKIDRENAQDMKKIRTATRCCRVGRAELAISPDPTKTVYIVGFHKHTLRQNRQVRKISCFHYIHSSQSRLHICAFASIPQFVSG